MSYANFTSIIYIIYNNDCVIFGEDHKAAQEKKLRLPETATINGN